MGPWVRIYVLGALAAGLAGCAPAPSQPAKVVKTFSADDFALEAQHVDALEKNLEATGFRFEQVKPDDKPKSIKWDEAYGLQATSAGDGREKLQAQWNDRVSALNAFIIVGTNFAEKYSARLSLIEPGRPDNLLNKATADLRTLRLKLELARQTLQEAKLQAQNQLH